MRIPVIFIQKSSHRTSPPTLNPPPTEPKNFGDFVGGNFPTKSPVQWGVVMGVGLSLGVKDINSRTTENTGRIFFSLQGGKIKF
jgi:hypothetical protein